jgi:hypothetical protein
MEVPAVGISGVPVAIFTRCKSAVAIQFATDYSGFPTACASVSFRV